MRTFLNIIWHFPFFGFLFALSTAIGGLLWCCTIIGIPLGLGLFSLSRFYLTPFSSVLVSKSDLALVTGNEQNTAMQAWGLVIRILYFPFGLFMAICQIIVCAFEFISIIGIPCGVVAAKALSTIFNPINKTCVSRAVADQIAQKKAEISIAKMSKNA